ncbi:hypothetical protein D9M71_421730 [compost metagenome]
MAEAIQAVEQEGAARAGGKLAEQAVDLAQVGEDQVLLFRRRLSVFGELLQLFHIRQFQGGAAPVVDQQPLGDGDEKGARLLQRWQFATAEDADEGVLSEILGALPAAGAAIEPADQPFAVVAVQRTDEFAIASLDGQRLLLPHPKRDESTNDNDSQMIAKCDCDCNRLLSVFCTIVPPARGGAS